MASDGMACGSNGWMMMLADIVALMLAFFVLAFSMREMNSGEHPPDGRPPDRAAGIAIAAVDGTPAAEGTVPAPLARSPVDGHAIDQLQAPAHQAAGPPALAYLAAILRHGHDGWVPDSIWHDENMLTVALPNHADLDDEPIGNGMRPLLLSLAHLAGRFGLDLAIDTPHGAAAGLDEQVAQALRLRVWLADAAATATPEVTFGIVRAGAVGADPADRPRVALIVRPAPATAERLDRP
jgi:flagellar motor protein MotB